VDYATKRTPARILILICIIWLISILIASSHLFPIFRHKGGRLPDQCHLIGNVPYTIISTVGAFYIPLIGMCIIYWKIFQAAKFRIRRKAFNTSQPTSPMLIHPQNEILSTSSINLPLNHNIEIKKSSINRFTFLKRDNYINHDIEPDNPSTYSSISHHNDYQLKPLKKSKKYSEDEFHQQINNSIPSTPRLIISTTFNNDLSIPINTINNPLSTSNSSPSNSPRLNRNAHIIITETKSSAAISRKKIDIKRERKATKVLGVVMGCFILCWLPFFIEETICGIFRLTINEKIISILTWLGYLNSLLNPVIYTIFAPDFRQAFGKILFGYYRKRQRLKK
jgi:5-hydroxytryptamine receptor 1